ncbi:MAG: TIR domain-containing protein [Thiotrichaceae bacterium]|nr:TIR domain-containing protein [Thiotrichaceae bacterium]
MSDAFISYSRKNKAFVQKLADSLKIAARKIWVDWEGIPLSSEWWKEIESGIEHANTFIFIITPESLQSEVCGKEIEHALKRGKRIVPIIQNDNLSDCTVHPAIAALNWIYFREKDDFEKSFQDLLNTLNTDLDHLHTHTRLLNRALEWDKQGRDKSFLLVGRDLQAAQQWLSTHFLNDPKPLPLHVEYVVSSEQLKITRQKRIFTAIVTGFIITLFLAAFAEYQRRDAVNAKNNAEKNHIVALSALGKARLLKDDQLGSLLASVEAAKKMHKLAPVIEAEVHSAKQLQDEQSLKTTVQAALHEALYANYEINRLEGHSNAVLKVAINPKKDLIASVSYDGSLRLWQHDGHFIKSIEFSETPQNIIFSVDFSRDGEQLAVSTRSGWVYLYDSEGNEIKRLRHGSSVHCVLFSPDGRLLFSGGNDHSIKVWDIATAKMLYELKAHQGAVEDLSISKDGRWLASASSDNHIGIWDLANNYKLVQMLSGHEDRVYGVSFNQDSTLLVSASADNSIKLWKNPNPAQNPEGWTLSSKQDALSTAHSNWVYSVRFSPNGDIFASASADGMVKLWNHDGTLLKTFRGHTGAVQGLNFSPDGKQIITASADKSVRIFSLGGNIVEILQGHTASLKDVTYSPNGEWLASTGSDKTVILWNKSGLVQRRIRYVAGLRTIDFSPDGNFLVGAGYDNTIVIWAHPEDSSHDDPLKMTGYVKAWVAQGASVKSVRFSPDGKYILSASADNTLKLWKTSGEFIRSFVGHTDVVNDANFSPDGQRVVSSSADSTARIWDIEGNLLYILPHNDWVNRSSFSADSKKVVSASSDRLVRVWSVADGKLLKTLEGHHDWVWDARFSFDDKLIASGGADDTLRLWDAETGKMHHVLKEHTGWIRALAFKPKERALATASSDMTVIVWTLDALKEDSDLTTSKLNDLTSQACKILHNYLQNNVNLSDSERTICQ